MTRTRALAAVAVALVLASGTASYADDAPDAGASPAPAAGSTAAPAVTYSASGTWQLLALVNKHRRAMGLQPLTVDKRLAGIARTWAERMATRDVLSHDEPLFSSSSHTTLRMRALGENVGWNYSVADQHAAFLHSAGHRANIQLASFRAAGFAVVKDGTGRVWSTEDFGAPAA